MLIVFSWDSNVWFDAYRPACEYQYLGNLGRLLDVCAGDTAEAMPDAAS